MLSARIVGLNKRIGCYMVDDYGKLGEELPDCHSFDCIQQSGWQRIIEFITDPTCMQLSASRAMFIVINLIGAAMAIYLGVHDKGIPCATIITGLVASDAGVYFASTRKRPRCGGIEE
jgi:hypothetical protein